MNKVPYALYFLKTFNDDISFQKSETVKFY